MSLLFHVHHVFTLITEDPICYPHVLDTVTSFCLSHLIRFVFLLCKRLEYRLNLKEEDVHEHSFFFFNFHFNRCP